MRSLRHRRAQPLEFGAAVVSSDEEEQESDSSKSHGAGLKVNEISTQKCEKNYQKVKEESTKKLVVLGSTSSSAPAVWSEKAENVQLKGKLLFYIRNSLF